MDNWGRSSFGYGSCDKAMIICVGECVVAVEFDVGHRHVPMSSISHSRRHHRPTCGLALRQTDLLAELAVPKAPQESVRLHSD
jgi:hypothetical protein